MSFLDSIKQSALELLHATTNALHAQFANSLAQAGLNVSESDHVDTLMSTAQAASSASATSAPNYADHAVATFTTGMTSAMLNFAQHFLPAQFQGAAASAATAAASVASDVAASKPVDVASVGDTITKVAAGVLATAIPGVAPIAAAAEPLIEGIEHAFEGGASATQVATSVAESAAPTIEQVAASAADKALPGAGELVTGVLGAAEAALGLGSSAPAPSNTDSVQPANTQGV